MTRPETLTQALDAAAEAGIPSVVDPKFRNFMAFGGATVFKPNALELGAALGSHVRPDDDAWLEDARARVDAELAAALPRARWVVGDLRFVAAVDAEGVGDWTAAGPDRLPPDLSDSWRTQFPFTHPAAFLSGGGRGRYVVYAGR